MSRLDRCDGGRRGGANARRAAGRGQSLALGALVAAVALGACVADPPDSPPLAGATGPSVAPPPDDAQPATAFLAEAENAQLGTNVRAETDPDDDSLTYITAVATQSDPPADVSSPSVASLTVPFPEAGEYEIYVRFMIGPGGADDDSFYINEATSDSPSWTLVNSITGVTAADQEGYDPEAIVGMAGDGEVELWKWVLLPVRRTVQAGDLVQTLDFATREDGFRIDKFAFAIVVPEYSTGFTTAQLDAGEAGSVF